MRRPLIEENAVACDVMEIGETKLIIENNDREDPPGQVNSILS